ncbi:MAG: amidoligase family protein [Sneathiellaceae bacterium]
MNAIEGFPEALALCDGRPRRIGVELEFGGLSIATACAVVQELFDGTTIPLSAWQARVAGTVHGDFEIRLDSRLAQVDATVGDDLLGLLQREAAEVAGEVLSVWTPCEISAPPVPLAALPQMDRLAAALRAAGAEGSGARPHYAYALQLNPEVRALDVAEVLRTLQSFLLLEDWLRAGCLRDLSRRVSLFVRPFPEDYRRAVLQPGYRPDWDRLIIDYLMANPTRNRDLDMLPLFASVRPGLVAALSDDPRVKPRPAYHYRLPDSRLDEPGWSVTGEWRRWARVEVLAADEQRFAQVRRAFLEWGDLLDPADWQDWLAGRQGLEVL